MNLLITKPNRLWVQDVTPCDAEKGSSGSLSSDSKSSSSGGGGPPRTVTYNSEVETANGLLWHHFAARDGPEGSGHHSHSTGHSI